MAMKRKTRMYEPWGYQDENNYESAEIIHDNDLASFFADVSYNKDDNKIHFDNKDGEEVGTLDVSEFLKSDSIVEKAWYENGKIYIKFTNGDVITINVEELIDQNEFAAGLQVNDGIVSVLINAESDDYISVDTDGIKLTGVKADIEAEEARAISAETALDEKIDAEIARATAEEQRIDAKLDKEIADRIADVDEEETRATEEETTIKNTIGGGFSTASTETVTAKFNALATALDTEIGDRTTQDNQLQNNINTETTAREAADTRLENLITDERNRAASEEQRIEAKLDQEIADRIADVNAEETRAISAETALDAKIDQEIADREADVDEEETRAKAAEEALQGAIDDEVARATSAETALQAAIEAEGQRAQDAETALDAKIDQEIADRTADVDDEEARAISAETELAEGIEILGSVKFDEVVYNSSAKTITFYAEGNVKGEIDTTDFVKDGMISDVKIEDGKLKIIFNTDSGKEEIDIPLTDIFNPANYYDKDAIDDIVSGINTSITDEATTRAENDNALSQSIDTEKTRAEAKETALQTSIESEATTARAAEQANADAIVAEKDRAEAAEALKANSADVDAALALKADKSEIPTDFYTKGEVDGKDNALQAAIETNAAAISAEETARIAADEAKDAIIATKADASAVTESIEAEAARAISAETDLQTAIDLKADKETTYTQEEVDALLLAKENEIYNLTKIVGDMGGAVTYQYPNEAGKSLTTLLNNNGTVKLGEDATITRFGPGVTAKNNVKLNLNNHNLTSTAASSYGAIMARGTQQITIGGKGTIDAGDGICIEANGTSTLEPLATFNLTGSTTVYRNNRPGGELVYCYVGIVNITNGTFRNDGGSEYMLNCYDANYAAGKAIIIVTGGKFYDFNPADNKAEGEHTSFVPEGYHVETSTVTEEGVEHTVYTVKKDA
jgi:hypothetical protein